jgi:hypothetical protein
MLLSRWCAFTVVLAFASVVRAQVVQSQADVEFVRAPEPAVAATGDGLFLPETLSPKVGALSVFGYGSGGYDSSRHGQLVDSAVEARIWGPFAIRAAATYSNDTNRMRPSVAGRVQLLKQEKQGVDGSLTVFFKTEGFTETEGEIETFASLGHRFERVSVMGDLVYGQDPEGNERDGEVHAAVFHQHRWLMYGLDSRVRFAIGTQHGHAATTEPVFDFLGGPVVAAANGPVAVFAQVGPSAFELDHSSIHVGVAGLVGVGAAY